VNTYYYFSSGRFPYFLTLEDKVSNQPLYVMNIHAKAGTNPSDFSRRTSSAITIRDSILSDYKNKELVLIGDFNDKLEGSITSNTYSSYYYLLTSAMKGISLPSKYPNKTTYVWNASIIDNICATPSLYNNFTGSFTILDKVVNNTFTNYGNSTSDHYPVVAYFKRNLSFPVSIPTTHKTENLFTANLSTATAVINANENSTYYLYNSLGTLIEKGSFKQNKILYKPTNGLCILVLSNNLGRKTYKW
jgi:hypothetical protein